MGHSLSLFPSKFEKLTYTNCFLPTSHKVVSSIPNYATTARRRSISKRIKQKEGDLISTTILGEATLKSMAEIVKETQRNKERSGEIPSQSHELKDYPSTLSRQNLHQEEEEEDSLSIIGDEWIKIGDEYFKNPVATTPPPDLRDIKEFATDPLFQSGQNDNRGKRKVEEAPTTNFVPGSSTAIRCRVLNVEEKYVKLDDLFSSGR